MGCAEDLKDSNALNRVIKVPLKFKGCGLKAISCHIQTYRSHFSIDVLILLLKYVSVPSGLDLGLCADQTCDDLFIGE
jgi:hypothetical protein